MYSCTIVDICKITGFNQSHFRKMMETRSITLKSYFRLCEGLCQLSVQYSEDYYLVRIKHALLQKDLRNDESLS